MRLIESFLLSYLLIFTSTSWARDGHGEGGRFYSHSPIVVLKVRINVRYLQTQQLGTRGNINAYTGKNGTKSP